MMKQPGTHPKVSKVELLAPGGDADAVKAALLAGADAVYCGLQAFNARQRAENITPEQLGELIPLAHQHACRMYLTLNTLVCENEFEELSRLLQEASRRGIDAVIVQDWGLLYFIKKYFPAIEVHASTQMTTHNTGQIALLARPGISQVNLCRELSLEEITGLCAHAAAMNMIAEVFVHGAYCISFSGQCYMSSAISGRSGNRGECVQPCRRSYFCGDGHRKTAPLNLKDNSAFARLDELLHAGVGSFKIEGRIKNAKYVHATVSAWRRQLVRRSSDAALENDDPALHTVFNRSLSSGYLDGRIGKTMFIDSSRDQSLVQVAVIRNYTADTGILKLANEVTVDSETPVLIYSTGFTFVCTGFIDGKAGRFEYRLRITHKLKGKIRSGDVLYRQGDYVGPIDLQEQIDRLQITKRKLDVTLQGTAGTPLAARFIVDGRTVSLATETPLAAAKTQSLTKELLAEKLGMLGETEFELAGVDCSELQGGLFLPLREINDLRRRGVALLAGGGEAEHAVTLLPRITGLQPAPSGVPPSLAILVNDEEDLRLPHTAATKVLFELPVTAGGRIDYYTELFRRNGECVPWFPSILIGEHYASAVALLQTLRPALIVTDNSGIGLAACDAGIAWIAGPLLNCTNSYALVALQHYGKCSGAFISHELSRAQMTAIKAPPGFSRWYTVFAPLLLMNTRQCIVRNCSDCGKEFVDEQCIASCNKRADLLDDKKNPFYVVKRPGFLTQVYNGRHYFNPGVINDVDGDNASFVIDLRSIPSQSTINVSRGEFVRRMERAVAEHDLQGSGAGLHALVSTTTAGQYIRGI